ncbi:MAG: hypothetical protein V4683_19970, partial [Bacteroidota bacterium]
GNTSTTSATFTIEDTTDPTLDTTAADQIVECDGAGNTLELDAWLAANGGATATDACSSVTWSNDFTGLSDDCGATGSATVTFTATDDCGNTSTTSATFTIEDTTDPAPVCQSITIELDEITGLASITNEDIDNGSSDGCSSVTLSLDKYDFDCSNIGENTVVLTVTDDCGNSSTCSATVTVTAPTKTTAKVSAPSVRYMDDVTLYAEVESVCEVGTLTGTVEFFLDGVSVGTAPAYPIPVGEVGNPDKLRATLIHKVTELPKIPDTTPWVVTAVFTPTTLYYLGSEGTTDLLIKPREAAYTGDGFYTGDVFVWTPTETSSTGTVLLAATIKDTNIPTGDVRGARVTFYYRQGSNPYTYIPIPSATNLPVNLVNMLDGTVGTASATVQLNIGNQNSASWTIAVGISGAYINRKEAPTSIALITVSKPVKGGYIVGGGEIANTPNTNGWIRGAVGQSTSFSMDVKFNNKGTNPQGKVNGILIKSYYKPDGTLDNKLHQYEVKSTAISVLAVGQTTSKKDASFTSKANLVEIIDGLSVGIEGNANLQVSMIDKGTGANSLLDVIAITLHRKAGGIWFSSEWNGSKTIEREISSGDIYVSSTSGARLADEAETNEEIQLKIAAFPNPSEGKFTLQVEGNEKENIDL